MSKFTLENLENWLWRMMIIQPDFITVEMFEEAAEVVEEATETVGKDVADTMQDAIRRAEDVGAVLEQNKADIDAAVEDAEGAATE